MRAADGQQWSLAGEFNDWTPAAMTDAGTFYWAEVDISQPSGLLYKFVAGDSAYSADPNARSYGYDSNGQFSYVAPPDAAWRLDRWDVSGTDVLDRGLRIYVPPGAGPWPVLYMHDGQNLFDPGAPWGGWRMQEAVTKVGQDVLIVGIENTAERLEEYGHTDDSISGTEYPSKNTAYETLVSDVVRPMIEGQYPTTSLRGIMGSSMGGVASLSLGRSGDYAFVGSLIGHVGMGLV